MATRKTQVPGATETTPDPVVDTEKTEAENTTGTVSEPVEEVAADTTTSDATTDPTPTAEATQALPDDYEEYLAWKNSRAEQAKPKITATETASTGAASSGVKRMHPVLGPKGWTQEEY